MLHNYHLFVFCPRPLLYLLLPSGLIRTGLHSTPGSGWIPWITSMLTRTNHISTGEWTITYICAFQCPQYAPRCLTGVLWVDMMTPERRKLHFLVFHQSNCFSFVLEITPSLQRAIKQPAALLTKQYAVWYSLTYTDFSHLSRLWLELVFQG